MEKVNPSRRASIPREAAWSVFTWDLTDSLPFSFLRRPSLNPLSMAERNRARTIVTMSHSFKPYNISPDKTCLLNKNNQIDE
jgi:hypothetical protein